MKNDLLQSFKKFSPFTIGSLIIPLVNAWVCTPLFINSWGKDIYASWIELISILSFLSIIIGSSLKTYQYEIANNYNKKKILQLLYINFITNLFIIILIFIIFLSFYCFVKFMNNTFLNYFLLIILFLNQLFYISSIFFLSHLRIIYKYLDYLKITFLYWLCNLIIIIVSLKLNFSPIKLSYSIFLLNLIFLFYSIYFYYHITPKWNFIKLNFNCIKFFISHSLYRSILNNVNLLRLNLEIIVISFFFNPSVLLTYTTINTMVGLLSLFNVKFYENFEELFSSLINFKKKLKKKSKQLIIINLSVSFVLCILLWIISEKVYNIWLKGLLDFDQKLFLLAIFLFYLNNIYKSLTYSLTIENKIKKISLIIFFCTLISIFISYKLMIYYDVYAFLISSIFFTSISNIYIFKYLK